MACDEALADRLRAAFLHWEGVTEMKMFGGVCFLVNGHMCCGVSGSDLVLRLGEEATAAALKEPHTRPLDFTGKAMKTMLFVSPEGYRADDALKLWLDRAVGFVRGLPRRKPKPQGERR